jgi:quinol monooxygenase YgiN
MMVPIENQKELTQTISLLLSQSRTALGRLSSRLYSEIDSEDNYVLMEEWESRAHWARYLKSDDFAVLFGAINALSNTAQLEFMLLSHIAGMEAISAERGGHS